MPTPVKLPAAVEQVIRHTDAVKTLLVRPAKKCPTFKPGQFLHLAMDAYDPSSNWPESRVFSIASSPTRRETLRIIFSVKGRFTREMFDELKEGDEIYVKLPYGSFTFPDDDRPLVLVAGGTGITPFLSYLEYAIDMGLKRRTTLYYGLRSPEDFVCGPVLLECRQRLDGFSFHCYLEQGTGLPGVDATGLGFIPLRTIVREDPHARASTYYLSGPPVMITDFRQILAEEAISGSAVRVDDWT